MPAFLKGDSGSGVHHEAQAVGAVEFVAAPEFDALQVLDAFVAVVGRGDEAQRGAVFYRQGLAVEVVGEEYVGAEQVFERQAGAGAVLGAQYDEVAVAGAALPLSGKLTCRSMRSVWLGKRVANGVRPKRGKSGLSRWPGGSVVAICDALDGTVKPSAPPAAGRRRAHICARWRTMASLYRCAMTIPAG